MSSAFPLYSYPGLLSIQTIADVPSELLNPEKAWANKDNFSTEVVKLAKMFQEAFKKYEADCPPEVGKAGPVLP